LPELRRAPIKGGKPVAFDDVMDALRALDVRSTETSEPPMRKFVIAVAVAAVLWTPEAASRQTILQKTDWRTKPFETYLPPPISVPGLDLDIRTKPPKLDAPFGWQANALPPYQLHRSPTDARVSSTAVLDLGRM
jgi:hypothetical protein